MDMASLQTKLWRCNMKLASLHRVGFFLCEEGLMDQIFYNEGFHFNVNDMFYWACADSEKVLACDLEKIENACEEAGTEWGPLLFVARKRKMRPQGAVYSLIPDALWPLFNAAGPERKVDYGNPCPNDNTYKECK